MGNEAERVAELNFYLKLAILWALSKIGQDKFAIQGKWDGLVHTLSTTK